MAYFKKIIFALFFSLEVLGSSLGCSYTEIENSNLKDIAIENVDPQISLPTLSLTPRKGHFSAICEDFRLRKLLEEKANQEYEESLKRAEALAAELEQQKKREAAEKKLKRKEVKKQKNSNQNQTKKTKSVSSGNTSSGSESKRRKFDSQKGAILQYFSKHTLTTINTKEGIEPWKNLK